MKKDKICVVRLDTDNVEDIIKFKDDWARLKVDVVFIPKRVKFKFEKEKHGGDDA